jgi:hypothetical protein
MSDKLEESKVLPPSEEDVFLLAIGLGLAVLRRVEVKEFTSANFKTAAIARELIRSQIKEISGCFQNQERAPSDHESQSNRSEQESSR